MKIVGYRCDWPECEFLTCRKYVMVNHINGKHTNQRPYSCPLCNFNFVKRYFLKAHMHKVHKRRISIDKDGDDDCSSPGGGLKRDHDLMMDSFDDSQFDGFDGPDTPATPMTPISNGSSSSNKKARREEMNGYGQSFYSNPISSQHDPSSFGLAYCGPGQMMNSSSSDYLNSAQQQQYHADSFISMSNCYGANDVSMISGRVPTMMNGIVNGGCGIYQDDSAISDITGIPGNSLQSSSFKNNATMQSSAVFMTPSPSSSMSSPLPFTANGSNTNPKFGFGPSIYDSNNSFDCGTGQQTSPMYPTSNDTYNSLSISSQQQQPPFLTRSYSQSSAQSTQSMYGNNCSVPVKSGSVGSNPMLNQSELLTPPLSNSSTTNCCRNGIVSNGLLSNSTTASPNKMFGSKSQTTVDSYLSSSQSFINDSAIVPSSYSSCNNNSGPNNFEDFLSPPSSISSSGSANYSSGPYVTGMCPETTGSSTNSGNNNNNSGVSNGSGSANQQRQAPVGCPTLSSTPTSLATASSFYLHTPSPSPSSLSHSPASGPTMYQSATTSTNGGGSSSYNNNQTGQPPQQQQYQTNFSNTFSNNVNNGGSSIMPESNSLNMSVMSSSQSSFSNTSNNNKVYKTMVNNNGYVCGSGGGNQPLTIMGRSSNTSMHHNTTTENTSSYQHITSSSQQPQHVSLYNHTNHNNVYDSNFFFDQDINSSYGHQMANGSMHRSVSKSASTYNNYASNSMTTNGLFESYPIDSYGQPLTKQIMYSSVTGAQAPPPSQPTFLANSAECWNTSW